MKIKLFQSADNDQWYFHIQAGNNKIIAQSEGYKRKRDALKTIYALIRDMPDADLTVTS